MLDDLRNSASTYEEEKPQGGIKNQTGKNKATFLGMTAPQRFIIALMLLGMTCVCGTFALLIFEKVVPPFF